MSSIKNTTKFHPLNSAQQKGLKMQLNKLDLHNKLLLVLNKKIEKFPHNKINDKMGGSLNQNIIFNFSNKNVNTDRRLINKQNLLNNKFSLKSDNTNLFGLTNIKGGKNAIKLLRNKVSDLGPVLVKTPSRLGVLNNVIKILTSFFNNLSCYISRPQFINKADKLIIKIFFYQNNSNKDDLSNNNKLNFIYDLFNGKAAAKAQYNAPKSQNFAAIIKDMLGQTKWNKIAQTIFNNNETINSLELANISKKVFILFIKDLMNLIVYNKELSIEKALIQLQKGTPVFESFGPKNGAITLKSAYNGQNKLANVAQKKYNKLYMKLISSTNSETLSKKRIRLSKTFFNKSLLAKLQNNIKMYNNTDSLDVHFKNTKGKGSENKIIGFKELTGNGVLMSPVTKAKLNYLSEWSSDKLDLSAEYKVISKAILLLLKAKNISIDSNNINAKKAKILADKVNNYLILLSKQFANEFNNNTNFIAKPLKPFNSFEFVNKANLLAGNLFENRLNNMQLLSKWNGGILNLINKNLSKNTTKNTITEKGLSSSLTESLLANKLLNNKNNILVASGSGTEGDVALTNVKKFKLLGILLAKIFKKNIDLQLFKLHNVGLESTIASQVIAQNAKFDKTSTLLKKILRKINISKASLIYFNKQNKILSDNNNAYDPNFNNKVIVPVLSKLNNNIQISSKLVSPISNDKQNIKLSQLYDQTKNIKHLHSNPLALGKTVGLSIRIAGRLRSDPIKPKQTVKTITVGSLAKEKSNISDLGSFTSKNRKGTYRISLKMAHIRTFSTSPKQ